MNELNNVIPPTNFTGLDWAIVIVYIGISLFIGIKLKDYIKSMDDFIGAGRGVPTWLSIATLTGGELGLITIMYSSQNGYMNGFAAFHIPLVSGLFALLLGCTGLIISKFRQTNVLTIPEFYGKRYNKATQILGGIFLTLGGVLNMGLFLKAGSIFIVGITGLDPNGMALKAVMVIMLVIVLVYTILGGMVSVIITDYIQFVVLSVGLVITVCLALNQFSWNDLETIVQSTQGEKGFDPTIKDGPFGITYVLWTVITAGLVVCAIWPTTVSRILTAESSEVVKKQFRWSSFSFTVRQMVPMLLGICAFAYVTSNPAINEVFFPKEEGADAANSLYALPIYLRQLLPIGLIGIITAAMIAAFMSTHDTYMLTWASVMTQDIVAPIVGDISVKGRVFLTRIFILLIGFWILYWGIIYDSEDQSIWDYMNITGAIYFTGAIILIFGGLYWKRASSAGAIAAILIGSSAIFALSPFKEQRATICEWLNLQKYEKVITTDTSGSTPSETVEYKLVPRTDLTTAEIGLGALGLSTFSFIFFSLILPDKRNRYKELFEKENQSGEIA